MFDVALMSRTLGVSTSGFCVARGRGDGRCHLLQRSFQVGAPGLVWFSDITYVGTDECWLFVAATMDLFPRKIVGWSMSTSMPAPHRRQHESLERLLRQRRDGELQPHAQDRTRASRALPQVRRSARRGVRRHRAVPRATAHPLVVGYMSPIDFERAQASAAAAQ
jgi:transposase InsO family protein